MELSELTTIRQFLLDKYKLILYNGKILDSKYYNGMTKYLKLKKNKQLPMINYKCELCHGNLNVYLIPDNHIISLNF
jgi:hypothetical protein